MEVSMPVLPISCSWRVYIVLLALGSAGATWLWPAPGQAADRWVPTLGGTRRWMEALEARPTTTPATLETMADVHAALLRHPFREELIRPTLRDLSVDMAPADAWPELVLEVDPDPGRLFGTRIAFRCPVADLLRVGMSVKQGVLCWFVRDDRRYNPYSLRISLRPPHWNVADGLGMVHLDRRTKELDETLLAAMERLAAENPESLFRRFLTIDAASVLADAQARPEDVLLAGAFMMARMARYAAPARSVYRVQCGANTAYLWRFEPLALPDDVVNFGLYSVEIEVFDAQGQYLASIETDHPNLANVCRLAGTIQRP
jgi:hypothetical protein